MPLVTLDIPGAWASYDDEIGPRPQMQAMLWAIFKQIDDPAVLMARLYQQDDHNQLTDSMLTAIARIDLHRGGYANEAALIAANDPVATNADAYAINKETDTFWVIDAEAAGGPKWVDSGLSETAGPVDALVTAASTNAVQSAGIWAAIAPLLTEIKAVAIPGDGAITQFTIAHGLSAAQLALVKSVYVRDVTGTVPQVVGVGMTIDATNIITNSLITPPANATTFEVVFDGRKAA